MSKLALMGVVAMLISCSGLVPIKLLRPPTCGWGTPPYSVAIMPADRDLIPDVASAMVAWNSHLRFPMFVPYEPGKHGDQPRVIVMRNQLEGGTLAAGTLAIAPTHCIDGKPMSAVFIVKNTVGLHLWVVLVHELGHTFGLGHNGDPRSVMHASPTTPDIMADDPQEAFRPAPCITARDIEVSRRIITASSR